MAQEKKETIKTFADRARLRELVRESASIDAGIKCECELCGTIHFVRRTAAAEARAKQEAEREVEETK